MTVFSARWPQLTIRPFEMIGVTCRVPSAFSAASTRIAVGVTARFGLDDESRRSVDGAGVGHRELATGESVGSAAGCLCWHDLRRIDRWGGAEAARVIDRERPVTLELPVSGVDKRRGLDGP